MAKKKSSSAATTTEEHPERLPLEETWPAESAAASEDDGTEVFSASGPEDFPGSDEDSHFMSQTPARELGLPSSGLYIAPAPASEAPASSTTGKRAKQTVASMTREQAFGTFRDKLFELCFKYGFTLQTAVAVNPEYGTRIVATDIGDSKGTAKRALAVGNHISGLEMRK